MTDFSSWIQENWYQLGSFFVQVGFLFLTASFAGRLLRAVRASQEQVGALLRLSVSGGVQERPCIEPARASLAPSPYWAPASAFPAPSAAHARSSETLAAPKAASGTGFFDWWKAPMGVTTGTSSFHRVLRWFQMPAHS